MTNRSKSARKPRIQTLDLSFEAQNGETKTADNGGRPHGGVRGTKKHPPGIYSYDKGVDYHKQLRDDIDKLIEEDILAVHGSPIWSVDLSKEPTNSTESPLFTNKVLSSSKLENQLGYIRFNRALLDSARSAPPPSRDGVSFYRPNRTHQFLTNTELRDHATNETTLKYGKPTRTTLLRARQKGSATPVNAYELRRALMQRLEEIKANALVVNPNEFIQMYNLNDETETLHSFLTGARYNSAHCLDSKCMETCGVYMPRNNPLACFVIKKKKLKEPASSVPTPPETEVMSAHSNERVTCYARLNDSPRSDIDETSILIKPARPQSAYGVARTPPSGPPSLRPRSAWVGPNQRRQNGNESERSTPHIFHDSLSMKGSRMSTTMRSYSEPKLPSVHGISVTKGRKLLRNQTEDSFQIHQPPPTPTPRDISPEKPEDGPNVELPTSPDTDNRKTKSKPEMVDRCFNVPSIASDDVGNVREFASKPYSGSGVIRAVTKDNESVDPKRGSDPVGTEYSTTVNTELVYGANSDVQETPQKTVTIEEANSSGQDVQDKNNRDTFAVEIAEVEGGDGVVENGDCQKTTNIDNADIGDDKLSETNIQGVDSLPNETDCASIHSVDSGDFQDRTNTVFITEETEQQQSLE